MNGGYICAPTHRPSHQLYGWLRPTLLPQLLLGLSPDRSQERRSDQDSVHHPFEAYAYTTMSFGLTNAEATYQRAIQLCLADQLHCNVEAYVDNVVIKTKS
jgi:hypothetical protein